MKTNTPASLWLAALLVSGAALSSRADTHGTMNTTGFRPQSDLADTFLDQLDSSRIAVLPAVIRTKTTTTTSEAPQKAAVEFLKAHKLGIPEIRKLELNLGDLNENSHGQFQWFQNDEARLGEIVKAQSGADYYLTLEFLVPKRPSGDIAVFGIHIYVLDANGSNAFSFLLNSHHKMLVDADLTSVDSSEQGYEALVLKATPVALDALLEQVKQARHSESQ